MCGRWSDRHLSGSWLIKIEEALTWAPAEGYMDKIQAISLKKKKIQEKLRTQRQFSQKVWDKSLEKQENRLKVCIRCLLDYLDLLCYCTARWLTLSSSPQQAGTFTSEEVKSMKCHDSHNRFSKNEGWLGGWDEMKTEDLMSNS